MERPSNALRCRCGRGWLRAFSSGRLYCDHSAHWPDVCGQRHRGRRGEWLVSNVGRGNEHARACSREVRCLPYATKAPQADPSGGEA